MFDACCLSCVPLSLWVKFNRSLIQIYDIAESEKYHRVVVALNRFAKQHHHRTQDVTFNTITWITLNFQRSALHKTTRSHEINSKHIKHNTIVALHLRWLHQRAHHAALLSNVIARMPCTAAESPQPTKDFNRFEVWPLCQWRFNVSIVCTVGLSKYSPFISVWMQFAPFIENRPEQHWAATNNNDNGDQAICLIAQISDWNYQINWLSQNINVGSMMARPSQK